ncbi:MAG: transporter substrate-binding domain-containing protein [Burkholderiales bacterium]|nr:transporter substrate-binding domain-containing protein [Burkholderiales bacterium]
MHHPSRRATLAAIPALLCPWAGSSAQGLVPLKLVSGDLPPIAMPGTPGQRGVLLDLVEMLLQRADMPLQAEFFPWARALLLAGEKPRTLIVPLNRTAEREARFQWLVKLYAQRFAFMSLAGKPRVETLEQARELRVSGLRGSSNLARLRQLGVPAERVYQATSVHDLQRALERGIVDAVYGSELIHTDAWRRSGRNPALLQTGLALESADIWLAAQGGVTEAEQARLRDAHEAMLADGSVERLFKRYGLKTQPEDLR